ncbi:MAG: glycosyltransferase family protein [Oceanospirillaceae bacterium]|nr:glycosyltransferase family protein [Oceanospirillaceae bacterium]MCP5350106.1 glycosyltransferase family protein [Oceanospirillaceae bacterium]
MKHITAIIQARMSSSRLPGKVLMPLGDVPILELIIRRLRLVKRIDTIIVATSDGAEDDPIAQLCATLGVAVVRGDLHDVLTRFNLAVEQYPSQHYIRITADCPFTDPDLINNLIDSHLSSNADYSSNALHPTYPDGFDAEIFTCHAFNKTLLSANKQYEREHVTYFIYTHPDIFVINSVNGVCDKSSYRVTVDTQEDYIFVNNLVRDIGMNSIDIRFKDVVDFLDSCPVEYFINSNEIRNSGLQKSICEEKI